MSKNPKRAALLAACALVACTPVRPIVVAPAVSYTPPQTAAPVIVQAAAAPPVIERAPAPPLPAPAPVVAPPVVAASVSSAPVPLPPAVVEPAIDSVAAGLTWDIDVHSYESMAGVSKYVKSFSGTSNTIASRLERGSKYEPMIRRQLREGGLPQDLYYLALIESGFDPNAYSRAAAVGMWQFMTSTAKGVGLRVDWWLDERRDPIRSTAAAVTFLKGLREEFDGAMYLAVAAYNGGPGRVNRGLDKHAKALEGTSGDDLFFALADKNVFKVETREYVPRLIASAIVGKEPERYGLSVSPQAPFAYDSVRVGPKLPLAAIAAASGATVAEIRELNPQILRGMTPPKDSVEVRIPLGTAAAFDSALATLPDSERVGVHAVTSKAGDSMASLAKKAGITTAHINLFNPGAKRVKTGNLVAGQSILIPVKAVAKAATTAPDPAIERYGGVVVGAKSHVVVRGDNLGAIALKYGTSVAALKQANALRKDLIYAGQVLVIPGKK
jgi:membrane-bound lytic murein transglycosylase D